MALNPKNLLVTVDRAAEIVRDITRLSGQRLFVGIPDEAAGRSTGPASNAVIGYAMEFGLPNIPVPARPFLMPTIKAMEKEITEQFRLMGLLAMDGDFQGVTRKMEALGLKTADNVRARITKGIMPPLAVSTVRARLRRTQAGRQILAGKGKLGKQFGRTGAQTWGYLNLTPLIDTGQLRRSVTYVIRKRSTPLLSRPS